MPGTIHGIWSPGLDPLGVILSAGRGGVVAGSEALAGDWRALPGPDRAGRAAREPQLIGKHLLA